IPANGVRREAVGNGTDLSAWPKGGHTTAALGWFHNIAGVKTEHSTGPNSGEDEYTLQLNTNPFVGGCAYYGSPNPNCEGWEQFVFWNQGNTSGYDGSLFIQYWLIDYAPCGSSTCTDTCPSGWQGFHRGSSKNPEDCFRNASNSQDVQSYSIVNGLKYFRLGGASVRKSGYSDYITLAVTGGPSAQLYKVYGDNVFPLLSNYWTGTEFNVFGAPGGGEAVFNAKSTIGVRTAITTINGEDNPPLCVGPPGGGFTGETNNLNIGPVGSKWPIRNWPAIVFSETNVTKSPKPGCTPIGGL
ncbi:MAG TPA: hypothetical protein VHS56_13725, partial [Candidatus Cybelea sp.]|nr:hypothetical protein [Candidatus Cybelea sp.]